MIYNYGFCNGYTKDWKPRYTRASEILVQLDVSIPLQRAWINYVKYLCSRGEKYSHEASDILSGAQQAIGKSYFNSWNSGFVSRWS